MAQKILIKNSNTAGKIPLASNLELGELALNTYDGKLFTKVSDGAESVVDLTSHSYDDLTNKPDYYPPVEEDVEDIVGAMVTGNTENGIAVTYDSVAGKLNFDVNDPTITIDGDIAGSATMTDLGNITITTTNNDKGSSQNMFKNVAVTGQATISADTNNDTLTFAGTGSTTITTDSDTDTVTINSENTTYTAGAGLDLTGTEFSHADTSTAISSTNTGNNVIANIDLDEYGHVTGHTSINLASLGTMSGFVLEDSNGTEVAIGDANEIQFLEGISDGASIDIKWDNTTDGTDDNPFGLTFGVNNTDKGSSQNIWKTFEGDTGTTTADSNNDTLTISGGTGITTTIVGDVVTVTNDAPNVNQSITAGNGLTGGGSGASITIDVGAGDGIGVADDKIAVDNTVARLNVGAGQTQTFQGSITINQDLNVLGNTNVVQREISTGENAIILNADWEDATSPSENAGLYVYRGNNDIADRTMGIIWNESTDTWVFEERSGVNPGEATFPALGGGTQEAVYEIWNEKNFTPDDKVNSNISLTAGNGLTGGGDLTEDRAFNVGAGTGITVVEDAVELDTDDNRNVDHSTVSISAGNGLTGGGDITEDRTLEINVGAGLDIHETTNALMHADTSSQATVSNKDGNVIQSLSLDEFGHLTTVSSIDLDLRYATVAQGELADSALQSGDNVSLLTNDANYLTNVDTIDGGTF